MLNVAATTTMNRTATPQGGSWSVVIIHGYDYVLGVSIRLACQDMSRYFQARSATDQQLGVFRRFFP